MVIFVFEQQPPQLCCRRSANTAPEGDPPYAGKRYNCRRNMPTAVVRDGNIRMECSFLLDEEVSKEYIVENCIKMVLGTIWRGFCDLEKEEAY